MNRLRGAAQNLGKHVLRRGLANGTRYPHHTGIQSPEVMARESSKRCQRVRHNDARKALGAVAAIRHDQSATCASRLDIAQKAVAIGARAIQRDEQVTGSGLATVRHNSSDWRIAISDEFPANRRSNTSKI